MTLIQLIPGPLIQLNADQQHCNYTGEPSPIVLRIRYKSFGSGFGSGSGLKLVSDSDLDQKLAKTSFFCS
jgi:hypothetical protein